MPFLLPSGISNSYMAAGTLHMPVSCVLRSVIDAGAYGLLRYRNFVIRERNTGFSGLLFTGREVLGVLLDTETRILRVHLPWSAAPRCVSPRREPSTEPSAKPTGLDSAQS